MFSVSCISSTDSPTCDAVIGAYCKTQQAKGPILWSVGDSLTHGAVWNGSTYEYQGAWRCGAFGALTTLGKSPNFVGTVTNASDGVACAGTAHSGYNGSTAGNWNATYFALFAAAIGVTPDHVTIWLGANDGDSTEAANKVMGCVDQAFGLWPMVVVHVATMFPSSTSSYATLNTSLRAQTAAKRALGQNVRLVELANAFGGQTDTKWLSDGLHPTAAGYRQLGDIWAASLAPTFP